MEDPLPSDLPGLLGLLPPAPTLDSVPPFLLSGADVEAPAVSTTASLLVPATTSNCQLGMAGGWIGGGLGNRSLVKALG